MFLYSKIRKVHPFQWIFMTNRQVSPKTVLVRIDFLANRTLVRNAIICVFISKMPSESFPLVEH